MAMIFLICFLVLFNWSCWAAVENTFSFTCPMGYQAFHTFGMPLDTNKYPANCVKFEDSSCVRDCYWGGYSHNNRTVGDCGYFYDIKISRADTYEDDKYAVYVSGFEYDPTNRVDRAYCCISKKSLVARDSCQKLMKYTFKNPDVSAVNITTEYPSLGNPITRSVDVLAHVAPSIFDYVIQVCDTTPATPAVTC